MYIAVMYGQTDCIIAYICDIVAQAFCCWAKRIAHFIAYGIYTYSAAR